MNAHLAGIGKGPTAVLAMEFGSGLAVLAGHSRLPILLPVSLESRHQQMFFQFVGLDFTGSGEQLVKVEDEVAAKPQAAIEGGQVGRLGEVADQSQNLAQTLPQLARPLQHRRLRRKVGQKGLLRLNVALEMREENSELYGVNLLRQGSLTGQGQEGGRILSWRVRFLLRRLRQFLGAPRLTQLALLPVRPLRGRKRRRHTG